jgi:hypothetical protein
MTKKYTDVELEGIKELAGDGVYSWFGAMAGSIIDELILLRKEVADLKDPFVEESE